MYFKLFILFFYVSYVTSKECSRKTALISLRTSSYKFSIKLLDRMAYETGQHFIFSPLTTYSQLSILLEGARGKTLEELKNATSNHKSKCNRKIQMKILKALKQNGLPNMKMSSVIILDSAYDIKKEFANDVKHSSTDIFVADFDKPEQIAEKVNNYLYEEGITEDVIYPQDFKERTMLMADGGNFKSSWMTPFNPVQTELSPFYNEENIEIGQVNLMDQVGIFNMTTIPTINATVLEMKCDNRISMLLFLPIKPYASIFGIFDALKYIHLKTVFMKLALDGQKDVHVSLPRFEIETETDNLPELLFDMGIKRVFYPKTADFNKISDYKIYLSLAEQLSKIQVTEEGVSTQSVPEMLIFGRNHERFMADKPFAFMIVDKPTEIILSAGIYSKPKPF